MGRVSEPPRRRCLRVSTCPLQFVINGINPNEHLYDPLHCDLVARGLCSATDQPFAYGGFGGCVFDIVWILKHIPIEAAVSALGGICESDMRDFSSDMIVSWLVYAFRGTVGPFVDLAETWNSGVAHRLAEGSVAFLRQS